MFHSYVTVYQRVCGVPINFGPPNPIYNRQGSVKSMGIAKKNIHWIHVDIEYNYIYIMLILNITIHIYIYTYTYLSSYIMLYHVISLYYIPV